MKKIVIGISDSIYEKLRLEAIAEKKDISSLIQERIFHKPFSDEVETSFSKWIDSEFSNIGNL